MSIYVRTKFDVKIWANLMFLLVFPSPDVLETHVIILSCIPFGHEESCRGRIDDNTAQVLRLSLAAVSGPFGCRTTAWTSSPPVLRASLPMAGAALAPSSPR